MKRTPMPPRQSGLKRTQTKRSQPRRDWTEAKAKMEREGICRHAWDGECEGKLEAAHIVGRECDRFVALFSIEMETLDPSTRPETQYSEWSVERDRIVPLCTKHHRMYDAHELDILPTLTTEEQVQAVADAGSILVALQRLTGARYSPEEGTG